MSKLVIILVMHQIHYFLFGGGRGGWWGRGAQQAKDGEVANPGNCGFMSYPGKYGEVASPGKEGEVANPGKDDEVANPDNYGKLRSWQRWRARAVAEVASASKDGQVANTQAQWESNPIENGPGHKTHYFVLGEGVNRDSRASKPQRQAP